MEPREHTYRQDVLKTAGVTMGFLISFAVLGLYLAGIIDYVRNPDPYKLAILLSLRTLFWLFMLVIYTPAALVLLHFIFPDILVGDDGLSVQFAWRYVQVPWSELRKTKPARFLGLGMFNPATLVVARGRLTGFHRIYGLLFGFTGQPAFLVSPRISNYHLLISDIHKHIKMNRRAAD